MEFLILNKDVTGPDRATDCMNAGCTNCKNCGQYDPCNNCNYSGGCAHIA